MPKILEFLTDILYSVGKISAGSWDDLTRWIELNTAETFIFGGFIFVGIGGLSSWLMKKRAVKVEARRLKREALGTPIEDDSSEMSFFVSQKKGEFLEQKKSRGPVVHEKTRENIATLFNSLKSVPKDAAPEAPVMDSKEQPFQEFEKAAEILISEIKTDETQNGKFSKMTVEAMMIFEEEDLKESLDDWAKRSDKKGIHP